MTSVGPDPDLSEFFAQQGRTGSKCSVALALSGLDEQRAAQLKAALAAPSIQSAAISRTIKNWGVAVGFSSISRHRNKACHCDR